MLKKGFICNNSHHRYLAFHVNGRKTDIITYISHEKRELSDALLSAMARQISLSKEEFLSLIDCTITEEDLLTLYRSNYRIE